MVWNALALVLLAAVAAACIALGRWQLDRAQTRREMQHSIAQGRASAPLLLTAATPGAELRDWRRARARGAWRNDLTVLLDNRNQDGRPGYWVATPLVLADTGARATAVLVLRGWVARNFEAGLPEIPAAQDGVPVHGQLLGHVPRMYELPSLGGKTHAADALDYQAGMPVVTNLSLEDAAHATGLALLPVVLQQLPESSAAPDSLVRDWAGPSLDADKNVGYAMQWFGFATIALIAALVLAGRMWRQRVFK